MSTEDKNKLDELFKNGLNVPDRHFDFSDADWDAMEGMLDKKKKGGIIYWLPYLSAVAAVLLIFIGWWFFKPEKTGNDTTQITVVKPATSGNTNTNGAPTGTNTTTAPEQTPPTGANTNKQEIGGQPQTDGSHLAQNTTANKRIKEVKTTTEGRNIGVIKNTPVEQQVVKQDLLANNTIKQPVKTTNATANPVTTQPAAGNLDNTTSQPQTLPVGTLNKTDVIAQAPVAATNTDAAATTTYAGTKPTVKKIDKTLSARRGPQLAITAWVSPDINGVSSFKGSQWGKNVGVLFSVGVGKKLTISTGAGYSKKPYLTSYSNYVTSYQFKTPPINVTADCRVLDIPLNVDYKLYHRGKNAFSVGTGLSSYFMLRETYTYDFAPGHAYGPTDFTVVNKNRHILGVLNLNTTYQRELSNKFSVGVQPYLKIPLTDIGNSRVRLQSAGVAVGVSWNINSKNP